MNNDGDGVDPFELDPFGESEYDPSVAFAHVAAQQAKDHVLHATQFIEHELSAHPDRLNQFAVSARKSSGLQLSDLKALAVQIEEARLRVDQHPSGTPDFRLAVNDTVEGFHALKAVYEQLMHTAGQIAALDPQLPSGAPPRIDTDELLGTEKARTKVLEELSDWVDRYRGSQNGEMVVVKATPGVGKTYAMLKLAYQEYMARQRVVFAVRTKAMIAGPMAEMRNRILKMSPTGRLSLAVIYGRDETNCMKPETVQAVMAHGYAPGPAVCMQCEYYPDNSKMYGLGICGYYQERITADLMSKGARRGVYRQYPIIATTHASQISASMVEGGRYGKFWGADVVFFDEDPTDAMEIDTSLTEEQCDFKSRSKETSAAGLVAQVFREAIEIGKKERKKTEENGFKAPGSRERHSHPIHSVYDTVYTGEALQRLLDRALQFVATTQQVSTLRQTLRSISHSGSFEIQPGALAQVSSSDDINALDIPPQSLETTAEAVHTEMVHATTLRRIIYQQNMGHHPVGHDNDSIMHELERHTEVEPMSYTVRLECLPADGEKGRVEDEWRFVVREFRPLMNHTSLIIIGDAYAQRDHYEHLFDRDADLIDVVSELNPDARFLRVLDSQCNISEMRRGGLNRILAIVEAQLMEEVSPGDRVLIYGHNELRPKVEQWLEKLAPRLGIRWAYEHWWGGRGKDEYNGWEFTVCITDPVLSLSGIKHVANARAFRDSLSSKTDKEKLLHAQRCDIGSDRRGAVYALRSSHPRIALEHDRMNIAELTQALHRGRPAHNAVRVITYGEMEQSPDLIAQTETIVGPQWRGLTISNSRRKRTKQKVSAVSNFVTVDEAFSAMRAILDHYGVYSPWFSHALVTVLRNEFTVPQAVPLTGSKFRGTTGQLEPDYDTLDSAKVGFDPVVYLSMSTGPRDQINSRMIPVSSSPQFVGGGRQSVPGESKPKRPSARRGSTEPALPILPHPRTVIERVWHPPVYWRLLIGVRSQPKAIETAHARLAEMARTRGTGVSSIATQKWPQWAKGLMRGRRPTLFYDPKVFRVDVALREYYRIVENQYGPAMNGELVRPNAELHAPCSLSALPF